MYYIFEKPFNQSVVIKPEIICNKPSVPDEYIDSVDEWVCNASLPTFAHRVPGVKSMKSCIVRDVMQCLFGMESDGLKSFFLLFPQVSMS